MSLYKNVLQDNYFSTKIQLKDQLHEIFIQELWCIFSNLRPFRNCQNLFAIKQRTSSRLLKIKDQDSGRLKVYRDRLRDEQDIFAELHVKIIQFYSWIIGSQLLSIMPFSYKSFNIAASSSNLFISSSFLYRASFRSSICSHKAGIVSKCFLFVASVSIRASCFFFRSAFFNRWCVLPFCTNEILSSNHLTWHHLALFENCSKILIHLHC